MLDRVALSVECAAHARAVVGVAGDFLPLPVRFVDDRGELLGGQRRLRNEVPLCVHPGAVVHVDLDPVGAVCDLLAGGLARLDGTIHELGARRQLVVRRVAVERVAAGRGDGPGADEHPRTGHVALVDRLLDADVGVACALRLDVANGGEPLLEHSADETRRSRRPKRGRLLQDLHVVAVLLRVEKDMRVGVDHPRKHRRHREIGDHGAGRHGSLREGPDAFDPVSAHDDGLVPPDGGRRAVDERTGANHGDRRRRRCLGKTGSGNNK